MRWLTDSQWRPPLPPVTVCHAGFTEDLKKFDVPTLIMHGEDDQVVPIGASAMLSSKLVRNAQLKVYRGFDHGMCTTHHDVIMAFTHSFIIVPDFPVTFQPKHSHTTFPWLRDERRDSRIGLLPRNGDASRIQWFEDTGDAVRHLAVECAIGLREE
jgi:hypothetical protein